MLILKLIFRVYKIGLTIDANAETNGPFRTRNLAILIRIAESREVFGAAFRSDNFPDKPP